MEVEVGRGGASGCELWPRHEGGRAAEWLFPAEGEVGVSVHSGEQPTHTFNTSLTSSQVCVCVLHPRCEHAVPGHNGVPVLLQLHLQQPDLSYPGLLDQTMYHNLPPLHALAGTTSTTTNTTPAVCLISISLFQILYASLCVYGSDMSSVLWLADSNVEACLKELGFRYRSRFLQQILDSHGGPQWLPAGRGFTAHSAQGGPQGLPQPFRAIKGASPKGAAEEWLSMNQLYVVHYYEYIFWDGAMPIASLGMNRCDRGHHCECIIHRHRKRYLCSTCRWQTVCVSDGQGLCCACGQVWQITEQDYICVAGNGQKSLTDKVCCEIGEDSPYSMCLTTSNCVILNKTSLIDFISA